MLVMVLLGGSVLAGNPLIAQAEQYEYDELNRVVKVIYEDGSYVEYTYDQNGNILCITVHSNKPPQTEEPIEEDAASEAAAPGETIAEEAADAEGAPDAEGASDAEGATVAGRTADAEGAEHFEEEKKEEAKSGQKTEIMEVKSAEGSGNKGDKEQATAQEPAIDSGTAAEIQGPERSESGSLFGRVFGWIENAVEKAVTFLRELFS